MQAIRNKPRCKEDCPQHIFSIRNNNGNPKLDTNIQFCPKFRRDPHRPEKTIPEYNLDNRYYTHAFVLGTEKKTLTSNAQQEQMHFQTMIKDACEKNNQVVFPRPNEKNSYCSVCKEHFRNYFEHINMESHRIKIDAAIYNTEIKRLCDFYKGKWNGAHAKADQLIAELYKQNQEYLKGLVDEEEEGEQEQEEDEQKEGEGEAQDKEEINQEENGQQLDEEKEADQAQNQQEMPHIENGTNRKESKMDQQHKLQPSQQQLQQQQQRQQQGQQQQNQGQPISKNKQKAQRTNSKTNEQNKCKNNRLSSQFFDKRSDLVIFLRLNQLGKYEVVKDIDKYIKQSNIVTLPLNKQQKIEGTLISKVPENKSQPIPTDRQLRTRDPRRKDYDYNYKTGLKNKQPHHQHKIKNPQKQKQPQSQYRDNSSSFEINENRGLCEVLKDKVMRDRIRTRNQCKEEKVPSKNKDRDRDRDREKEKERGDREREEEMERSRDKQFREKEKEKQKERERHRQKQRQYQKQKSRASKQPQPATKPTNPSIPPNTPTNPYQSLYHPHMNPYAHYQQPNPNISLKPNSSQMPQNPNNAHKMTSMPPYPMYMPPPQQHPQSQLNAAMMKQQQGQGGGNTGGVGGGQREYMPHPGIMMNPQQFYGPGAMGYGMPPPQMRPPSQSAGSGGTGSGQDRNASSASRDRDDKSKERPPQPPYPMYYPNWNPYMMNPHAMMRPEQSPNSDPQKSMQIPPGLQSRQPMVYPHPHNPYHMMIPPQPTAGTSKQQPNIGNQPQSQPQSQSQPQPQSQQQPRMPQNPGMYMQYQMDPRYYIGYHPAPVMKKTDEPPAKDPR